MLWAWYGHIHLARKTIYVLFLFIGRQQILRYIMVEAFFGGLLLPTLLLLLLLQRAIVLGIKKSKLARLSYSNIYTEIGKLFFLRWDLKVHTMYIYIVIPLVAVVEAELNTTADATPIRPNAAIPWSSELINGFCQLEWYISNFSNYLFRISIYRKTT